MCVLIALTTTGQTLLTASATVGGDRKSQTPRATATIAMRKAVLPVLVGITTDATNVKIHKHLLLMDNASALKV